MYKLCIITGHSRAFFQGVGFRHTELCIQVTTSPGYMFSLQ